MDDITTIKDAIRRINPQSNNYSIVCTVSDIDLINGICNCTPVDGSGVLVNVRLNADNKDGFKLIPKDSTKVLVTLINNTTGFISMVSEVDEIHLNGVNYDGLVKVQDLTDKLNALENKVNDLITACSSQVVTLGPSGTFPLASFFTSVTPLTPTIQTDIENLTVKQGNGS